MENATKALMIAAAVLVAILIISLGIGVFTSASEQMGDMDLTEYQVEQHNGKFTKYVGTSVIGSEVNALYDTVLSHNNAQEATATCVNVKLDNKDVLAQSNAITKPATKVPVSSRYTVEVEIDAKTKLVDLIKITTNK